MTFYLKPRILKITKAINEQYIIWELRVKGCAENRALFDRKFNWAILAMPIQTGMQMDAEHLQE